jgi:hypothetical protein
MSKKQPSIIEPLPNTTFMPLVTRGDALSRGCGMRAAARVSFGFEAQGIRRSPQRVW